MFPRERFASIGRSNRGFAADAGEPRRNLGRPLSTIMLIVACDFLVVVTARFRILFVFVALEIGSRRILHCNVTAHPTAEWTFQQLRDAIPSDRPYQFLIHDRDTIFSAELDAEVKSTFGLRVTAYAGPGASGECLL
jgi:putative transposase